MLQRAVSSEPKVSPRPPRMEKSPAAVEELSAAQRRLPTVGVAVRFECCLLLQDFALTGLIFNVELNCVSAWPWEICFSGYNYCSGSCTFFLLLFTGHLSLVSSVLSFLCILLANIVLFMALC